MIHSKYGSSVLENKFAINNLNNEGLNKGIFNCGDVMEEVFESVYKNIPMENRERYSRGRMKQHGRNTKE